jgi:ABC-2 type transport system ATP-binding protein
MISIGGLSKKYGSKAALTDINLLFEPGKAYGVVGENGAGKTTLFRCIAGLENFEGSLRSPYIALKDNLGFLPTEPYFFSKITGREHIQLLCNARNVPTGDIDHKNIFELPLDQYASTYSTGMKKKLALTAILLQKNEVFILDEPFNGVDVQSNMIIAEIIHRLKSDGKTLIISSHIFSTLRDSCDEIVLLKNGNLVKKIEKDEFDRLEQEMRDFSIGDRIDRLFY